MEKYDIAIDARMINASGIGTYLQNILPDICRTFKTALIGRNEELKVLPADVIEFEAPIYSIKETFLFPFKIPDCKIFWSPHFNVPILASKAEHTVSTIHDVFHLAFHSTLSKKQKLYASLFYNLAVARSDKVITVSHFSKQEILKYTGGPAEKICVIYNGVHKDTFAKPFTAQQAEKIKGKYKLPQSYILYVGNVKPHKNLLKLVYALEDTFFKYRDLFLVVVGKREGFITGDNKLTELINNNPLLKERIVFTGFADQKELPHFYQNAKLFVMPSIYEGFGLPPLEAMSAGTLTAVSNKASLPEICKKGTLYFNPNDPKDIAQAIERGLNMPPNEKEKMKQLAFRACKAFSWEKSIKEHLDLFNGLLNS